MDKTEEQTLKQKEMSALCTWEKLSCTVFVKKKIDAG